MSKSARLKKKKLQQLMNIDKIVSTIPSFMVVLKVANDVLYDVITLEEKTGNTIKLNISSDIANKILDKMTPEITKRVLSYEEEIKKYKIEFKKNSKDPDLLINISKNLALIQSDNINYIKNHHPLYNEEFCNSLTISEREEGKEALNKLKEQLNTLLENTSTLLSSFYVL